MYSYRIDWMGRVFWINRATCEAAMRDRILKLHVLRASSPSHGAPSKYAQLSS
jgi:hypothetical protein